MEDEKGWYKSSFSTNGNCVEVLATPERVRVRHTRDRSGPELVFTPNEWNAFLQGVRVDEFNLPERPDRPGA